MMLQFPAAPPPVLAPGTTLPATICNGLPRVTRDKIQYCVLGIRLTGDAESLEATAAKLGKEGWLMKGARLPTGDYVAVVDANGKDWASLQAVAQRLQRGEFGPVHASVSALPDPAFKK